MDKNTITINWKRKLTSRKFWAAVIGVVASVLAYCGANESTVTQVTAIITAGATLVAYIVVEGLVDAAREERNDPRD
jgi:choline-glycine betaine transporter